MGYLKVISCCTELAAELSILRSYTEVLHVVEIGLPKVI